MPTSRNVPGRPEQDKVLQALAGLTVAAAPGLRALVAVAASISTPGRHRRHHYLLLRLQLCPVSCRAYLVLCMLGRTGPPPVRGADPSTARPVGSCSVQTGAIVPRFGPV